MRAIVVLLALGLVGALLWQRHTAARVDALTRELEDLARASRSTTPPAQSPARAARLDDDRSDDDEDDGFFARPVADRRADRRAAPRLPGALAAAAADAPALDDGAPKELPQQVQQLVQEELQRRDAERSAQRQERRLARVQERAERIAAAAQLDDAQRKTVTDLLVAEEAEIQQLRQDARAGDRVDDLRQAIAAVRARTDENAAAVLREDQRAIYAEERPGPGRDGDPGDRGPDGWRRRGRDDDAPAGGAAP